MPLFLVHARVSFFNVHFEGSVNLEKKKNCGVSQEILGWHAGLDAMSIVWPLVHCSH